MARETLEDLRDRLLRQHNVQHMIQVRAYEIYRMRGSQPGGEAQDWLHAEGEVLAFLIANESAREDEQAEAETAVTEAALTTPGSDASRETDASASKKPRARAEANPSKAKRGTPKTITKRSAPRKSAEPRAKSKRTSKQSKTEEENTR